MIFESMRQKIAHLLYKLPFLLDKILYRPDPLMDGVTPCDPLLAQKILERFSSNSGAVISAFEKSGTKNQLIKVEGRKVAEAILRSDEATAKFLRHFIGMWQVDIMYFFNTKYVGEVSRQSQLWHHDSVGRRIKLFIPITEDVSPSLEYEIGSNQNSYSSGMLKAERESYVPSAPTKAITLKSGNGYFIDTNVLHRGIGFRRGLRSILVIEISHRLKSFCLGRVGKRDVI